MKRTDEFIDKIMAYIYPPRCMFCDEVLPVNGRCRKCEKSTARLRLESSDRTKDGMKDKHIPKLDGVSASFEYAEEVAEAVIRYKFCGETGIAFDMARYMLRDLKETVNPKDVDVVVNVPAFRSSDVHSRLLAKRIAKLIERKYDKKALVKLVPTRKQHELNRKERSSNVRNAFDVPERSRVEGKTVLICDDVITSGNTLNECARALKAAGAKAVYASVFSSTFMPD